MIMLFVISLFQSCVFFFNFLAKQVMLRFDQFNPPKMT
jgi:hypothetical protein